MNSGELIEKNIFVVEAQRAASNGKIENYRTTKLFYEIKLSFSVDRTL